MYVRNIILMYRKLNGWNRYGLEIVANMAKLPETGFTITVLPLYIEGGSGGPCRIVAKLN